MSRIPLITPCLLAVLVCGCEATVGTRECVNNRDCAAGQGCDRGVCRPQCDPDPCTAGLACVDGVCVAPICGNGVVEPPETCDGDCPTHCQAGACETAVLRGSAAACTAECVLTTTVTTCIHGDGCCASGCTPRTDSDCTTGGDPPPGDPPPGDPGPGDPGGGDPLVAAEPPLVISGSCGVADYVESGFTAPELHIIGIYQAGNSTAFDPASIHVDRDGVVALVLSSYESVDWSVTAASGTAITQVVLSGYYQHNASVPAGTAVTDRSGPNLPLDGGAPYTWDANAEAMAANAESLTGYALSSFTGCYDGDTFEIGQP